MSSVILCRGKQISNLGCREGLRLQKEVITLKKRIRNQNFAVFLLLDSKIALFLKNFAMFQLLDDSKIGDQETNE